VRAAPVLAPLPCRALGLAVRPELQVAIQTIPHVGRGVRVPARAREPKRIEVALRLEPPGALLKPRANADASAKLAPWTPERLRADAAP
jgi:hypothetical protein